jgi:hypothetical protein
MAIGLFNLGSPLTMSVDWKDLGRRGGTKVRDVWRQKDPGIFVNSFTKSRGRKDRGEVALNLLLQWEVWPFTTLVRACKLYIGMV